MKIVLKIIVELLSEWKYYQDSFKHGKSNKEYKGKGNNLGDCLIYGEFKLLTLTNMR